MAYDLVVEPEARDQGRHLPGHVRQRIGRLIKGLADEPRPAISRMLDASDLDLPPGVELRRARVENWRVVYAVNDVERWVWVWAVHRRPPYDYGNLNAIAAGLK